MVSGIRVEHASPADGREAATCRLMLDDRDLDGYRLCFNKKSGMDLSGKANIVPGKRETVWGVVFDLSKEEIEHLAGFESGYEQKTVEVTCPEHSEKLSVQTFIADANARDLVPTAAYVRRIVEGAREHGLRDD